MYSYEAPQTQACQPGSRYSTLLIRDDVEDEIRKPNNVVCRDHEMQIILGKSYCTDLLARKNSNHLSHTLTTSQKTSQHSSQIFFRWGAKVQLYLIVCLCCHLLKVSKFQKQNTKFSHPPKNQRNCVHFFALDSKKWLKQKIKTLDDLNQYLGAI